MYVHLYPLYLLYPSLPIPTPLHFLISLKDHVLRHPSRLAVKQPEALSVMVKSAALQTNDAKPPHQGGDKLNVALKLQPSRSAIPHGQITVTREDLLLKVIVCVYVLSSSPFDHMYILLSTGKVSSSKSAYRILPCSFA